MAAEDNLQQMWDEEAKKLDAPVALDAPAETLPQSEELPAEPPAEAAVETPAGEPAPAEEDPFAGLSNTVREKLARIDELARANEELRHHVKTAEGRVAAMQREFQTAQKAAAQVAPGEAPSQGQMAAAAKSPEKWKQLKSDFPEWAEGMEEFVASQISALPKAAGVSTEDVAGYVQSQLAQNKQEITRLIEEAKVEGKHEGWKEVVNSTPFQQWYSVQTPEIRALAESNSGRDAIRMLDLFQQAKTRPAAEIRQERGARLAAAATTRPGNLPPTRSVEDLSPEELWNYEAAARDKQRATRGF